MLKKLRFKFVLINMTIVTVILAAVFCLLYFFTSRNMERESMQMMSRIAMSPLHMEPPNEEHENVRLPYFCILVNHAGETTEIGGGYYDLSDEELIRTLLQLTYDAHTKYGKLEEYNLRFFRTDTSEGECIVFADMSSEQSMLRHMICDFAIIGGLAYLVFLGISILLARWAVRPVERAWKKQKQFVADASHELKTPLTVITTDAELIRAPECTEKDTKILSGHILTMSAQMRGLVENLLELARIDNGSDNEKKELVSVSKTVSEAAMVFEPLFFEKGLPFSCEIEEDIMVQGSAERLKQLTDILLDNASKYASPGGETVLRLRSLQGPSGKSRHRTCLLEVSNQGEPISSDDLKNLFERFYRADKARKLDHSYGLGLSIAKEICEQHHGKIRAESEGGYNRFFAELPIRNPRPVRKTCTHIP